MRALAWTLVGSAAAIIVSARVYHVSVRPDWTEAQMLVELWWVWLLVVILIFGAAGALIRR